GDVPASAAGRGRPGRRGPPALRLVPRRGRHRPARPLRRVPGRGAGRGHDHRPADAGAAPAGPAHDTEPHPRTGDEPPAAAAPTTPAAAAAAVPADRPVLPAGRSPGTGLPVRAGRHRRPHRRAVDHLAAPDHVAPAAAHDTAGDDLAAARDTVHRGSAERPAGGHRM
ncbi:MAG: hypothetical protein AVDCRST_MAG41-2715, partial [uncultured Corynebacteriales bacterium]